MKINLIGCLFALESERNENIKKNDIKRLKVLVDKDNKLPSFNFKGTNIKDDIKNNISELIGTTTFHLEQVYTNSYKDNIEIIYLAITNVDNIKDLNSKYNLVDFKIEDNKKVYLGDIKVDYKTVEKIQDNNIEYIHEVKTKDEIIERNILNLLMSYKRIRANIDSTDIIFKFMPKSFTLEDVRNVYELVKDTTVDKSNFRKKIIKYCEKADEKTTIKTGYRPSQRFTFKPLKGDIWL